jgi:hypothetical protein
MSLSRSFKRLMLTRDGQTPARNERLVSRSSVLSGKIIMRKMCRALAIRTRSDERALWFGFIAVGLSVMGAALFEKLFF